MGGRDVFTPLTVRQIAKKPLGMAKLRGGGPVKDTCDSSNQNDDNCNPDKLAARCDAAGGGMSSLPGGGVDCDTSHWD
jgi:hypothetical protein